MKQIFITIISLFFLAGCATPTPSFTITQYSNIKYSPTDPYRIQLFKYAPPNMESNYITIAEFTADVDNFSNLKNMLKFQSAIANIGGTDFVVHIQNEMAGAFTNRYGYTFAHYRSIIDGIIIRKKDLK